MPVERVALGLLAITKRVSERVVRAQRAAGTVELCTAACSTWKIRAEESPTAQQLNAAAKALLEKWILH